MLSSLTRRQRIQALLSSTLPALVVVIAGLWVLGEAAGRIPFHGDESRYLYNGRYFVYLFLQRDVTRPEWQDNYWTHTQPMLARYVVGGWLWARGYDLDTMPQPYDWGKRPSQNLREGRVPSPALLGEARAPMVLLAAGSVGLLYLIARNLGGPLAGLTAAALAAASPLAQERLVRALTETPFSFFLLLSLLLGLVGARRGRGGLARGWAIAAGVALGLGLQSKLTAVLSLAAVLGWAVMVSALAASHGPARAPARLARAWVAGRGWALAFAVALGVFISSNPHLYQNPLLHTVHLIQQRDEEMHHFAERSPEIAVHNPLERPVRVLRGSLLDGTWGGSRGIPLEAALASVGVAALVASIRRGWQRTGRIPPEGLVLLTVLVYFAGVSAGLLAAWSRYFLPTLLLGALLSGFGAAAIVGHLAAHGRGAAAGLPVGLRRTLPSTAVLELAAVVAIALAALAVRWPELATVPRFTDETKEVMLGLQIARGEVLPLTNSADHIGPLFNYLIAAAHLLLGPRVEVGRLVVMLFSALTVVPTFLLGRSIGGTAVGLLSAALVAASATHVVVSSHIAYSHSIMPLFSTTGVWLLHRAVTQGSGPSLALSGLMFGLAFQTHLSVLAIWPGLAVYLVWKGRPLVGRWLLLAVVAALLAVANLALSEATNGWHGVVTALDRSDQYRSGAPLTLDRWAMQLGLLLRELPPSLAGLVSESTQASALFHPAAVVYALLATGGLVLLCRRNEWLLCLAILSGVLLISLLNGSVAPIVARGRHYLLLLPLGYVAVAELLVALYRLAARAAPRRWIAATAGVAALLIMLAVPMFFLHDYYEHAYREYRTNGALLQAVEAIARSEGRADTVYLDRGLNDTRTLSGGRLNHNVRMALEARGFNVAEVDVNRFRLPNVRPRGRSPVLVLNPNNVGLAARRFRLDPLAGNPGSDAPLHVFRAQARGGA